MMTPRALITALSLLASTPMCLPAVVDAFAWQPCRATMGTKKTCRSSLRLAAASVDEPEVGTQRRTLGSQELLFLPRQYSIDGTFPQANQLAAVVLSATPSVQALTQALDDAIQSHPLLRAHVEGNGQPIRRIDANQMVRQGNPDPETFVAPKKPDFSAKDLLTVVDVPEKETLTDYWQRRFREELDDDSWCNVHTGPLWKVELHRQQGDNKDKPCALVFCINHVISDQGCFNVLFDQILADIADIEQGSTPRPTVEHEIPVSLEDSVLGMHQRWEEVGIKGLSLKTFWYAACKSVEPLKSFEFLPDNVEVKPSLLDALELFDAIVPGGKDEHSSERKTTIQFRSVSEETTSALLKRCRENGVSVSNAVAAAVAYTSTDFIDGGVKKENKSRVYKVLQSLDMRRFGEKLDKCETLACEAGSMDLILGPLPDRSGEKLRHDPEQSAMDRFWDLAKKSGKQTMAFVKSDAKEAVRVFDLGMSISEMNRLIDMVALSKDFQGRYYSAGITNAGVYERQKAVRRQGDNERSIIQGKHGRYTVEEIYFATSHARLGCLYPVSCMTVGGKIFINFNPACPLVSEETNVKFADAFVELLETIAAGVKEPETADE